MARYQADVWLGSSSGRQRVYVNSNTWNGAREQIKTIYHVNDNDIWNLNESRENNSVGGSDSSSISAGSILGLALIALVISFWKYFLILGVVALIIWIIYLFRKEND
jgi:hypothetical protein